MFSNLSLPSPLSVSHTLGPCAAATSRAAAESIGAREKEREREREKEHEGERGREGWEEERESEAGGKWREIKRERKQ